MIDFSSLIEDCSQTYEVSLVGAVDLEFSMIFDIGENTIRNLEIALIFVP